jgi:hypothetical protein
LRVVFGIDNDAKSIIKKKPDARVAKTFEDFKNQSIKLKIRVQLQYLNQRFGEILMKGCAFKSAECQKLVTEL